MKPLDDIRIYTILSLPQNNLDREYKLKIFQTTFNVCKVINGISGDFLAKILKDVISRTSNVDTKLLKCPSKINRVELTNVSIKEDLIPTFLLKNNSKGLLSGKMIAKVEGKKVQIATEKVFVRVVKNWNIFKHSNRIFLKLDFTRTASIQSKYAVNKFDGCG